MCWGGNVKKNTKQNKTNKQKNLTEKAASHLLNWYGHRTGQTRISDLGTRIEETSVNPTGGQGRNTEAVDQNRRQTK